MHDTKIKTILNRQRRDILIAKGKEDFERVSKSENIVLEEFDDKIISGLEKTGVNTIEDLYFGLGKILFCKIRYKSSNW